MQITTRPISALKAAPNNARTHGSRQIDQLAASIRAFGFNVPVLINGENTIIAGHGRVRAAKQAGLTEVPCVEITHLDAKQVRAFMLADNRIALSSDWDDALLRSELEYLEADFDLGDVLGFSDQEIDALCGEYSGDAAETVLDAKAARVLSEDAEAEESADAPEPAKREEERNPILIPLFVNLTPAEHQRWVAMKKEMGEQDNTKAFRRLAGFESGGEAA